MKWLVNKESVYHHPTSKKMIWNPEFWDNQLYDEAKRIAFEQRNRDKYQIDTSSLALPSVTVD